MVSRKNVFHRARGPGSPSVGSERQRGESREEKKRRRRRNRDYYFLIYRRFLLRFNRSPLSDDVDGDEDKCGRGSRATRYPYDEMKGKGEEKREERRDAVPALGNLLTERSDIAVSAR